MWGWMRKQAWKRRAFTTSSIATPRPRRRRRQIDDPIWQAGGNCLHGVFPFLRFRFLTENAKKEPDDQEPALQIMAQLRAQRSATVSAPKR